MGRATGGTIIANAPSVTFHASEIAGVYGITLQATDGTVVNRQAIDVEVIDTEVVAGAFLSIEVDNTVLPKYVGIGSVQPSNHSITDGINVSSVINAPGQSEIVLTLVVLKLVERGWQLQNTVLVGVKGSDGRI